MPNLLRFCLLSILITGLAFNVNARRSASRRVNPQAIPEVKTTISDDSLVKPIAPVFDITSNKLNLINRKVRAIQEKSLKQDTGIKELSFLNPEQPLSPSNSLKPRTRPDCRETNPVNKDKVADSYPFISSDGLRLYFTSNREGGHGRFFISKRNSVKDPFREPIVLSKNLTDGYYAGTLTADELILCMVKSGKMYISKRENLLAEFSEPVEAKGIADNYHYGPAISPDGNEIIVMSSRSSGDKYDIARIYRKIADGVFREAGVLPAPKDADAGPGQFSKDGLSYYLSFETPAKEVSIWRYTRKSVTDDFIDLEELPVKINGFQRNCQPSVNADASIIVYTTSQNDLWEEDDIVLVNDDQKNLSAPEQFTHVTKNDAGTLTIMGKITTAEIKVFPNPFQNEIIFEMSETPAEGTIFILYDLNGKMIKQQAITSSKTHIQLGGLPSATYIYQVVGNRKTLISSGKLVKIQ